MRQISFILLLSVLTITTNAETKHAKDSNYPSYKGLVMAGYQGWFRAVGDEGGNTSFGHYGRGAKFDENNCTIDAWPDVTEYKKTYSTEFRYDNGEVAKVFSSVDESTTDIHFKWMQEYGVDGVFMQRFFNVTKRQDAKADVNVILKNALNKASKYNRAIAVMYDLSGLAATDEDCSSIIEDWKFLVDQLKVTNQEGENTYLHHNEKPVVAIWGVGFPDRPYNIRQIGLERLIDFLHNDPEYGGCSVMLGVPTYWRELAVDCQNDPYLHTLIKKADILLPWMVQRFTPLLHNDMNRYRDMIIADRIWCDHAGIDYVPAVCPGFSWYNLSRGKQSEAFKTVGSIPRLGGLFYWQQLSTAILAGAEMVYVAMFDEVDEGTAIFKCSNRVPQSDVAKFIDMDNQPTDHYLWLTGEAARMLRGEKPLQQTLPQRK